MQFEPVEPPDGALPPGGHPLKNPVVVYPSVVTDFDVGGINEIDPPGLTQATCFQEEHHGDGHPLLEGDEPAVGYHPGEVIPVMDQQMLGVEMLEICEMPAAGRFTISEIANFATVTEDFVKEVRADLDKKRK